MLQEGSTILQENSSSHPTNQKEDAIPPDTGQSTIPSKRELLSGIVQFYDESTKEWSERLLKHATTKQKEKPINVINCETPTWFTVHSSKCNLTLNEFEGKNCEILIEDLTNRIKQEVASSNLFPPVCKAGTKKKVVNSTTSPEGDSNKGAVVSTSKKASSRKKKVIDEETTKKKPRKRVGSSNDIATKKVIDRQESTPSKWKGLPQTIVNKEVNYQRRCMWKEPQAITNLCGWLRTP